jgi:hypothetical protein
MSTAHSKNCSYWCTRPLFNVCVAGPVRREEDSRPAARKVSIIGEVVASGTGEAELALSMRTLGTSSTIAVVDDDGKDNDEGLGSVGV